MIGVGLSSDAASPLKNPPPLSILQLLIFYARVIRSLWLLSLVKSLLFKLCCLRFLKWEAVSRLSLDYLGCYRAFKLCCFRCLDDVSS
ncbi:unnamed protein product [Arabis nemorensis]|uniref:Uncharacterized protein n=1 Tax=Arabis nemorensis TaxID=586526 RepID=A0A565CL83_9BRAS|nr:unnamed protein product [Arabis nemorensis]